MASINNLPDDVLRNKISKYLNRGNFIEVIKTNKTMKKQIKKKT
mgnify:FL=1